MMTANHQHGVFTEGVGEEVFRGVVRQSFSSERSTVNSYRFEPGASFPIHRHSAEQVTLVQEGELRLMVDGAELSMSAGEWSTVAGGVPHGITAGSRGAHILAIISPARANADEYEVVDQ